MGSEIRRIYVTVFCGSMFCVGFLGDFCWDNCYSFCFVVFFFVFVGEVY